MAGFVAENIIEKRMPVFYPEEIAAIDPLKSAASSMCARRAENEQGCIPSSLCIPLDSLRERLGELDKSREILVYCQVGLRGYSRTRILLANGFRAKNLSGGYKTWSSATTADYDGSYVRHVSEASCSSAGGRNAYAVTTQSMPAGSSAPAPLHG